MRLTIEPRRQALQYTMLQRLPRETKRCDMVGDSDLASATGPEELSADMLGVRDAGRLERRTIISPLTSRQLVHELRVHQIELELQNEELRRMQLELAEARSRYFDLYDLAPVGYCTVSEADLILEANLTGGSLLGLPRGALVGKRVQSFLWAADQDVYYLHRKRLFDTRLPQSCEVRLLRSDGTTFWSLLRSTLDTGTSATALHRLVLTDISERKELDRALREKNLELQRTTALAERANQAKSDFLSSMSHELRTPLNSILGFAQLLEAGKPELTELQQKNIQMILRGGWYLLSLINEILDLSSIESGKLALSLEPVAVSQVLADCQSLIAPQAEKSGIVVNFPVLSSSLLAMADPIRLKQVIVNLLSNAIKYNRPHGVVDVSVSHQPGQMVCIRVQDTGEGLSEEKVQQLFQPFNRLGQESNGTEGTGIGLVLTRRLTELMGGQVGVQSTVGVGSSFWIELRAASV